MDTVVEKEVTESEEDIKNFISYFQSVTTIGIINRSKSAIEAEDKAKQKISESDFMCGVIGQTPFEVSNTDEWEPNGLHKDKDEVSLCEPRMSPKGKLPKFNYDKPKQRFLSHPKVTEGEIIINLDDNTKRCIADKFCKDFESLQNSDYSSLISTMIEDGLE